jgi:NTE family protein
LIEFDIGLIVSFISVTVQQSSDATESRYANHLWSWGVSMSAPTLAYEVDTPPASAPQMPLSLALQGGGSHGAFTWGALDRLLENEDINIDGISATSAGSINAVVLAHGLTIGGRAEAKKALAQFWRNVSTIARSSFIFPSLLDKMTGRFGLDYSAGYLFTNALCQFVSPYQFNPLNLNPLRDLLRDTVDFQLLREQSVIKLFLSATNVESGKLKVFNGKELTADHVIASSCLPFLMQAIEINGEHYWDGGLIGNPALFPLIYECEARDIVLVHVTPVTRSEIPTTAEGIMRRVQELSLNSSLFREMRAVSFVNALVDRGRMIGGKKILIHEIEADDALSQLTNTSKMNADWDFLLHLHSLGRRCANGWLSSKAHKVGVESTIDMTSKFL